MRLAFLRLIIYDHALTENLRLKLAIRLWKENIRREHELTGQEKYLLSLQERTCYKSDLGWLMQQERLTDEYAQQLF